MLGAHKTKHAKKKRTGSNQKKGRVEQNQDHRRTTGAFHDLSFLFIGVAQILGGKKHISHDLLKLGDFRKTFFFFSRPNFLTLSFNLKNASRSGG